MPLPMLQRRQALLRLLWTIVMPRGVSELFLGLAILLLSLVLWSLTHSVWGWAALFLPGSCYVALGWAKLSR